MDHSDYLPSHTRHVEVKMPAAVVLGFPYQWRVCEVDGGEAVARDGPGISKLDKEPNRSPGRYGAAVDVWKKRGIGKQLHRVVYPCRIVAHLQQPALQQVVIVFKAYLLVTLHDPSAILVEQAAGIGIEGRQHTIIAGLADVAEGGLALNFSVDAPQQK